MSCGMFSACGDFPNLLQKVRRREFALAARLALRIQRGAQKGHCGDAGNFHRILKCQKHSLGGALIRRHFQQIFAFKPDLSARDLITWLAGDDVVSVDLPDRSAP